MVDGVGSIDRDSDRFPWSVYPIHETVLKNVVPDKRETFNQGPPRRHSR